MQYYGKNFYYILGENAVCLENKGGETVNALYLILVILGVSGQNAAKKAYSQKNNGGGVYLFGAVSVLAAAMFFLFTSGKMQWDVSIIPYAIGFAAFYAMAVVFGTIAVACGPLSITALISSYSLILPTLFGLLFLQEPVRFGLFPGLCLLFVSLVLINRKNENIPITPKWILCVTLSFLGNGGCSIVQKLQQSAFAGAYKNEFMIIALSVVLIVFAVFALLKERKQFAVCAKSVWWLGAACGIMNGVVNLLVMVLSGKMPASFMFPVISAGGIVATFVISTLFYRERLTKLQLLGFVLGAVSVVLLNI